MASTATGLDPKNFIALEEYLQARIMSPTRNTGRKENKKTNRYIEACRYSII